MCGIVGYFGSKDAKEVVINGLEKLEYRGYDSAGIAILNNKTNELEVFKKMGRINDLRGIVDFSINSNYAIGHTRWATHGAPSDVNSHPHYSENKKFIIVHNGVIENNKYLKVNYLKDVNLISETDTEVIANLIEQFAKNLSTEQAIRKTLSLLEGSYSLLIIDTSDYNKFYIAKDKTPLLIGIGETGVTVSSDIMALVGYCSKYYALEDKTFGIVDNKEVKLYDIIGEEKKITFKDVSIVLEDIEKGNYEHYMLKEIEEQPTIIRNLIDKYFVGQDIKIDQNIVDAIKDCNKINLVGCGTSMYASYLAKYYFEKLCGIPSEVFCASELVYSTPLIKDKPFFIYLSQSGETADSISVLKKFKKLGYKSLSITNSVESTMIALTDYHLSINAGKEIAVASTKAYTAQIATCAILAKRISEVDTNLKDNLSKVAIAMENIIANKEIIENVAKEIYLEHDAFYIGRGIDYWACLEASLKLKEISYIHTEAYPSGELKHGPIALIKKDVPVIAILTQEGTNMIARSNLTETQARGAKCFVISMKALSYENDTIIIPDVAHYLTPLTVALVTQYIAYYTSILKGNDVDKPKNLAKSVTVE